MCVSVLRDTAFRGGMHKLENVMCLNFPTLLVRMYYILII